MHLAAPGANVYHHLCYSVLVCDTAAGGCAGPGAVVVKCTGLPRWSAVVTLRPLPCLASPLLLRAGQRWWICGRRVSVWPDTVMYLPGLLSLALFYVFAASFTLFCLLPLSICHVSPRNLSAFLCRFVVSAARRCWLGRATLFLHPVSFFGHWFSPRAL